MTALVEELPTRERGSDPHAAVSPIRLEQLLRHLCVGPNPESTLAIAPFTGRGIIAIPHSDDDAVDTAFAIAREAAKRWAAMPVRRRAAVLRRFHDLLLARRGEGLDLVQLESGKARIHAVEELVDVAIQARHYSHVAPKLLKPTRHRGPVPVASTALEVHHPKGVVGVISPWNYPLTLAVGDAIPALLAGNGVVLKPDLQTTLSALWLVDLLYEAGLPDGLFGVVPGEGPVVGPMVTERGDYVMFTGSTAVGRQVAARCGERLVGCSMELGGKNAMIVCADASIGRAAEIAQRASFANAGQLCISMERIYVHRSIFDEFASRLVERVRKMRMSSEIGWQADVGSLISRRQLDTVTAHVDDAVAQGASVLVGGRPRPDVGPFFFEPTVLANVQPSMICFSSETFGPVVSLYAFDTEDEAIALANDTAYGLNASVLTGDLRRGRQIAARLKAGTVNVNEGYATAWAATSAPMGGFGDSGLGRRHGREGLMKYTESQTIGVQRFAGWGTPPFLTHRQWGGVLVEYVALMKKLGRP